MALRLRVVSEHAKRLGDHGTKVFGVHGGTIGRSTANEWILPDPERYLSGKHARIDFRAGTYVLVDTSSNGTYINGSQVPLGKYHDYVLKDGDYVRLGEYELLASIDKSNDFPPEEGAIVAYDGRAGSGAAKKSTANDLGEDLDLSQLLESSESIVDPARAKDPYVQAIAAADAAAEQDESLATPWHMMTRPIKLENHKPEAAAKPETNPRSDAQARTEPPARPDPPARTDLPARIEPPGRPESGSRNEAGRSEPASARNAAPTLYDSDFEIGLTAFCRGAGVDPRAITPEARTAALQLAGQLLREAVLGLMDLNQSRNEFRNRFRIPPPVNDAPESPLSFSRGVDEALVRLLTTLSMRAGSVEAIRHNFRELKAQSIASQAATHAAFEEFLARVNPAELEERFERASKRGVFGSQNKVRYWELYSEMFNGLAQRPEDGFPHVFTEAFAKAYEAKMRTLVPPRRGTFGGDRPESLDPPEHAVGDR